ncbi:K Homology domain type 1 superfamily [Arabidopsis thaliana x Arabidopsis arenosa]|uniref:K Homology domain type 1 superfamily n=1 Tax=Arabidopsis thaliana x Arabidopsis arenosa TaxID=1240361 RepID=A0A8T1ZP42_9BRAS|nr:K Homology domain type 1 superfamily [Arabidopsis thaliana x Arabidopsis arenosa]
MRNLGKKDCKNLRNSTGKNENEFKYVLSERRDVTLCLLCPKNIIGGIIGKGHQNINRIRQKTGAMITICPSGNGEDAMVVISASEICELHSPVEYAAQLLFPFTTDESGGSYRIRLLVEKNTKSECLDEHWICQVKQISEAVIIISSNGDNQIVEIIGLRDVVKKAFDRVLLRLRRHCFKLLSDEAASRFSAKRAHLRKSAEIHYNFEGMCDCEPFF